MTFSTHFVMYVCVLLHLYNIVVVYGITMSKKQLQDRIFDLEEALCKVQDKPQSQSSSHNRTTCVSKERKIKTFSGRLLHALHI